MSSFLPSRAKATLNRKDNGDWGYAGNFDQFAKSSGARVGKNQRVIDIEGIAENGNIVFTNEQLSLIKKLSDDPRNQLLGGVITNSD